MSGSGQPMNGRPDAAMTWFRSEQVASREGAFRVPALVRWPGVIQPTLLRSVLGASAGGLATVPAR